MQGFRRTPIIAGALAFAASLPWIATGADPASAAFRLVGGTPASVAGVAQSPQFRIEVSGGSGQPTGIAVSGNASVVSGSASTQLPTDRIFTSGLEEP